MTWFARGSIFCYKCSSYMYTRQRLVTLHDQRVGSDSFVDSLIGLNVFSTAAACKSYCVESSFATLIYHVRHYQNQEWYFPIAISQHMSHSALFSQILECTSS